MFLLMHLLFDLLFSGMAVIVDSYGVQCLVQGHRGKHFNTISYIWLQIYAYLYKYVSHIDDFHL